MSSAPTNHRGPRSAPAGPGTGAGRTGTGLSGTRRTGAGAATAVPGPGRTGGWSATAARYLPIAVPAAVMAVLGVWGLPRHNAMGNDEIVTRYAATLSLGQLAHLFHHTDIFHALYYLLMHCWVVLGTTPTIIRIPSVIAATAGAALVAYLGRRLSGSGWTGLFAGLVMALTPSISYYAQTAREYTGLIVVVLCSTLALVRALEAESAGSARAQITRRWALYTVLIALGGYLNELSLALLIAHAATVLLARPGRNVLKHWVVAGAVGGILVLPIVIISIREDSAASWITRPDFHDLGVLFHVYFGSTNLVSLFLFGCAVVAVAVWARGRPAWWSRGGISLPSVAVPLLALPSGTVYFESLAGKPLYAERYVLYCEAGAALLAGAGLDQIGRWVAQWAGRRLGRPGGAARRPALAWVTGSVVCLSLLPLQLGHQQRTRTGQIREFNYGPPAHYVEARARPGDGVLFFNQFYRKARLGYPQDFRDTTDFAMAVSPVRSGTLNGFNKPFSVVGPLMLTYNRIWVVGRPPSAHVSNPAIRAEGELLMSHYTRIAGRKFKGMWVTLWLRR